MTEEAIGQAVEKSVVEQIGVQQVTAVSLIQSELRPTGAVYTRLLNVALMDAIYSCVSATSGTATGAGVATGG